METTDDDFGGVLDMISEPSQTESDETEVEQDDEAPEERTEADDDAGDADDEADEAETDDDDDRDADEEAPDESLYTITVDGEEKQVTLDELKRGYSGQSYIQKGMREAAEMRKRAETETQQAQQLSQALIQMYQQVQTQGFKAPPKPPTPEMAQEDPIGYMQEKAKYDIEVQQFQAERQQMSQLWQYHQQQTEAQRAERLQAEAQRLIEQIPELGDAKKAPEIRNKLMKTGADIYGFSEAELGQIEDSRALSVLYDAMRYRELQSTGKERAAEKAKNARPFVKPSARRATGPRKRDAAERMKKTGSIDDVANYLISGKD